MERFVMDKLLEWKKKKNRKPLVIMGARQVGKTWLMREFGKRYYDKVAYISFYNNERMKQVFESGYDINRIIAAINIEVGLTVEENNTLIIFDEIQNAPKAFESLKYFCEDAPHYHVIVAGSLLGVALHRGVSYPVGKVDLLSLHPLSFKEFLCAVGEQGLYNALQEKDYTLIDDFRDKYIFNLKNYFYVGGMPEVVETFREKYDYKAAREVQKSILAQYKGDFGKHTDERQLPRINMVWESIPMQLAKENKKFFFGKIKEGARSAEFEVAIQWLVDAGLIYKVHKVNEPHIPLSVYKDFSAYKIFMLDVGLLGALSGIDAKAILEENRLFVEFKGALTEQYVHQQLISDTEYEPYYYGTNQATFEQDFLIQDEMDVVPIEVKADKNVRSQSLKAFYDKFKPKKSIRFSLLPYMDQGWMVNVPLYAVGNI
ncbi:MAG: ATP-binding protein [Lachnospiraceae bacterium]|nr:ATP-binding protein [Lachnospiraceae bacterium]